MQTKVLLKSVQAELLEECCWNFSKLKLFSNIAQVQILSKRPVIAFLSFLVFKNHIAVSVFLKFIQSRIMTFLKARHWVHKKCGVFLFFPEFCESTEHLLCAIAFAHSHVHSLKDSVVRWILSDPSKRNWASERVSSVFKVAQLVSGGAGNPTVSSFLSYTSNCLFIVLTGTQLRRCSHAQPLQCETKHSI